MIARGLTFGTEFGRYYSVQFSDDLAAWQPIESPIPATGGTLVHNFGIVGMRGFFRIVIHDLPFP
jgi:hypothetical protein